MLPEKAPQNRSLTTLDLLSWSTMAISDAFSSPSRNICGAKQLSAKADSHQQNCTDAPVSKGLGSAGYTDWQKGIILYHCGGLKTSKHNMGW